MKIDLIDTGNGRAILLKELTLSVTNHDILSMVARALQKRTNHNVEFYVSSTRNKKHVGLYIERPNPRTRKMRKGDTTIDRFLCIARAAKDNTKILVKQARKFA